MGVYDLSAISLAIIDESAPNSNFYIDPSGTDEIDAMYSPADGRYKKLLVKFDSLSEEQLGNYLIQFSVLLESKWSHTTTIKVLSEPFDAKTVTWNTRPNVFSWGTQTWITGWETDSETLISSLYATIRDSIFDWGKIKDIALYGVEISYQYVDLSYGLIPPIEARVHYEQLVANVEASSPLAGSYVPKSKQSKFAWAIASNAKENNPPEEYLPYQTSATLKWRTNSEGTIHTVNAGTSNSITIPAGTFTTDTIQWCVTATMSNGDTITTDWITVSTVDSIPSVALLSPKNSVLDGTADCTFVWEHIISTGTEQTAFDLQTSQDNEIWTTLRSVATSETSVVIPANTLTGGDLYWRVRTYNTDGVAGEWSEAAHCIVVAAPDAPLISIVDAAPRFSIRWQQSGQQGYEIMLSGKIIAKKWGETSAYQYDGYLTPGTYTVQVRIQNKYGLWSTWSSAALPITNTEGAAITLYAEADNVVRLQWSTTEAYDAYLIYRDGQLIGRTQAMTFTDNFAVGSVSYEVRGIYEAAGNYTLSNAVDVVVSVSVLMISQVKDPVWQKIQLSASSLRSRSHSATQSVTYLHYTNADLPSAEIGEALDKTYRFDAAFPQTAKDAADAFEALIGKLVCVKDPDGYRIIGVLGTHSLTSNPFYRFYSCTVTLVNWQEGAGL